MDKDVRKYIKEKAEELILLEMDALEELTKNSTKPDEYAQDMKKTSQILLRGEMLCLSEALYKASINAEEKNDIDKLRQQTQLLDQIMLRMLSNADTNGHTDLQQYSLALRAQNQSRNTIMATEVLKQSEAKRSDGHKQIERNDNSFVKKEAKKPADSDDQTIQTYISTKE